MGGGDQHKVAESESKMLSDEPPVKFAKYLISQKSSVSKANAGKIENLGTFMERATRIRGSTATSNFFTNVNSVGNISGVTGATDEKLTAYGGRAFQESGFNKAKQRV